MHETHSSDENSRKFTFVLFADIMVPQKNLNNIGRITCSFPCFCCLVEVLSNWLIFHSISI